MHRMNDAKTRRRESPSQVTVLLTRYVVGDLGDLNSKYIHFHTQLSHPIRERTPILLYTLQKNLGYSRGQSKSTNQLTGR